MKRTVWEYGCLWTSGEGDKRQWDFAGGGDRKFDGAIELHAVLNELGTEGWELVGFRGNVPVLKRAADPAAPSYSITREPFVSRIPEREGEEADRSEPWAPFVSQETPV